jgi:hypothetical protein
MGQRSGDNPFPLRAVGDPAVVFAPSDLAGISLKVLSADPVMDTELTASSGPVGVREIERLIKKLEFDKEILADDGEEAAADE